MILRLTQLQINTSYLLNKTHVPLRVLLTYRNNKQGSNTAKVTQTDRKIVKHTPSNYISTFFKSEHKICKPTFDLQVSIFCECLATLNALLFLHVHSAYQSICVRIAFIDNRPEPTTSFKQMAILTKTRSPKLMLDNMPNHFF